MSSASQERRKLRHRVHLFALYVVSYMGDTTSCFQEVRELMEQHHKWQLLCDEADERDWELEEREQQERNHLGLETEGDGDGKC